MGIYAVGDLSVGARPAGDFGELYRRLSSRLERIVRLDVTHAPAPVVEDACQFAWGRLLHHRDHIEPDTALSWLARTAVHEALKLLKRERRYASLETMLELADDAALASQAPGADQLAEQRERLQSIADLPQRQQRVLWLKALGLSYAEIAQHTGYTHRTIERQLLKARQALREAAG